jgi:hypothetical protein
MRHRCTYLFTSLAVVLLLVLTTTSICADGGCPMSDWSKWQAYFTPLIPAGPNSAGNPAGRPIPTKSPSNDLLMAWVNTIHLLPEPAMTAHAEEVARGANHSTIIGHGHAKSEPSSINAWATGGVLRKDFNPGPFFEVFNDWYGETWRMIPHKWGAYAYRGADSVTIDREQIHKNESPTDGTYSLKIAGSAPFEAGVSRTIKVTPNAEVKVRVMYALYDHGGVHGGNVLTYDWASLGVKVDDCDATWVNGPWHGQWLPLEQTVKAGKDGRIMIFLQVISPLPENTNAYFDNVQVWVNGQSYSGS